MFCRFEIEGRPYDGRVCFKVLVEPKSYEVSGQTVALRGDKRIDEHFPNSELEWSTATDRAVYLYGLMIKVDRRDPS